MAWLNLVVEAGQESLRAQRSELDNMRTRAVSFVALTVTATAFLVGTGLADAARNTTFYWLAALGTVAFLVLAGLLTLMVSPRIKFRFILQPGELMSWIEGDHPAPSAAVAMRGLAQTRIPEMLASNEAALKRIRRLYRGVLVAGVGTLALWVAIVWVFT